MEKLIRRGLVCALAGTAVACSYDPDVIDTSDMLMYEYEAVQTMEPQGPDFNRGLRGGYLDYSDLMYNEVDAPDFIHFAFKAVDSAKGEQVLPDTVESRDLPETSVEELAAARARLMAALEQTGRKKAPYPAATAQTAYDCWIEREEEGDPPDEIAECKAEFERAIAEVERSLVTDVENVYLVFFAWDQADLSPVALTVLDQVRQDYERGRPSRLVVAGHADRSGPESYNQSLSERRARNVARALVDRGVPGEALEVEWYGESQPRVPTADGVREPQNRRVEIVFG